MIWREKGACFRRKHGVSFLSVGCRGRQPWRAGGNALQNKARSPLGVECHKMGLVSVIFYESGFPDEKKGGRSMEREEAFSRAVAEDEMVARYTVEKGPCR